MSGWRQRAGASPSSEGDGALIARSSGMMVGLNGMPTRSHGIGFKHVTFCRLNWRFRREIQRVRRTQKMLIINELIPYYGQIGLAFTERIGVGCDHG